VLIGRVTGEERSTAAGGLFPVVPHLANAIDIILQ
jgi:hypothetical protein